MDLRCISPVIRPFKYTPAHWRRSVRTQIVFSRAGFTGRSGLDGLNSVISASKLSKNHEFNGYAWWLPGGFDKSAFGGAQARLPNFGYQVL